MNTWNVDLLQEMKSYFPSLKNDENFGKDTLSHLGGQLSKQLFGISKVSLPRDEHSTHVGLLTHFLSFHSRIFFSILLHLGSACFKYLFILILCVCLLCLHASRCIDGILGTGGSQEAGSLELEAETSICKWSRESWGPSLHLLQEQQSTLNH